MRGFWADQRLEGGRWPQSNPFYRRLYRTWKRREARMIQTADAIVVLTEAARREIEQWPTYCGAQIVVIPCVVDFSAFPVSTPRRREAARLQLGIRRDEKILCYLGSLGTVYKSLEMLRYFAAFKKKFGTARMLFIGRHEKDELLRTARETALSPEDLILVSTTNDKVPDLLAASDVAICFITPTFSSLGVSPTKLGEYLATGLPVIANAGVGDVARILDGESGHVLPTFEPSAMAASVEGLDRLLQVPPEQIRERARAWHDLPLARQRYVDLYRRVHADRARSAA
jgi:glycosyltransferase involved in cell wall biosynthesis